MTSQFCKIKLLICHNCILLLTFCLYRTHKHPSTALIQQDHVQRTSFRGLLTYYTIVRHIHVKISRQFLNSLQIFELLLDLGAYLNYIKKPKLFIFFLIFGKSRGLLSVCLSSVSYQESSLYFLSCRITINEKVRC